MLMGRTPGKVGAFYIMTITVTIKYHDDRPGPKTTTRPVLYNYKLIVIQDKGQDKKMVWQTEVNQGGMKIFYLGKPGGGVAIEASTESPAPNLCGIFSTGGPAICFPWLLPCYPCIDCAIKSRLNSMAREMEAYSENYTIGTLDGGDGGGSNTIQGQLSKLLELYFCIVSVGTSEI